MEFQQNPMKMKNTTEFSPNVMCKALISQSLEASKIEDHNPLPHNATLKIYTCGKHCEKGEIAYNKQYLLFSQCFLPYFELIFHFKCTVDCRLQLLSVWTSLKFCRLVMG